MAWMQTNTGKKFDLTSPNPRLVDFEHDVAPALGKLARFVGQTDCDLGYSVAQHCVLGAETLHDLTGSNRLASLFLLHDAHEAYIGDISQPFVAFMNEQYPKYFFGGKLGDLKAALDAAIHTAAGVPPPDYDEMLTIKYHDVSMMNAERLALLPRMEWSLTSRQFRLLISATLVRVSLDLGSQPRRARNGWRHSRGSSS